MLYSLRVTYLVRNKAWSLGRLFPRHIVMVSCCGSENDLLLKSSCGGSFCFTIIMSAPGRQAGSLGGRGVNGVLLVWPNAGQGSSPQNHPSS